jgi:hypothetical protein
LPAQIAGIVRLLDDPETAKFHLRSELYLVEETAGNCKGHAGEIKHGFDYLVKSSTPCIMLWSRRRVIILYHDLVEAVRAC